MRRILLCIIAAFLLPAQQVWADYVTDVVVIGHDSKKQIGYLYDNYKGAGWICLDRDLNDGAGGHYIYLVYKTNKSPQNSGTPITDLYLRVSTSNDSPASFVHNGRTYYKAGADGDSRFISSGGDLNCEADGAWIHLYYTKDNCKPNHLVTEITVDGNKDGAVRRNNEADACDLNTSAGGSDIFLHAKTEYDFWDAHRASSFSHVDGNTIYIESEEELALMGYNVQNGTQYQGKTIILNRDLDLSAYAWNPPGYEYYREVPNSTIGWTTWWTRVGFRGNLDGCGHTIRGLYVDKSGNDAGLFACIVGDNGRSNWIKNLNIVDANVKGTDHVGILAGYSYYELTIENVMTQGKVSGRYDVGGILGLGDGDGEDWSEFFIGVTLKNCAYLGGSQAWPIYGNIKKPRRTDESKNYYANYTPTGNPNVIRLSTVKHDTPPEGINISINYSDCYWYNGVPYCKPGSKVEYTASVNTIGYDLIGTSLNGEKNGLSHSFKVAEGTDYSINVEYEVTGITGSGTEADPYLITTDKQWTQLANMTNQGRSFNGKYIKLGADINVSTPIQNFEGTFDGGGHTMNVNMTANDIYCAPFRIARSATIKNLYVTGTIATNQMYSAGLVGRAYGTTSITNCRSSVSILSSFSGNGNHGGFVGLISDADISVSIDGNLFDGKILTVGDDATTGCGGFVGEKSNRANLTITNCIYAPAELADGEKEATNNSATLVRYIDGFAPNIFNSGYTRLLGTIQGVSATDTKPEGIGEAVETYSVSGITSYTEGVEYNGWWCINIVAIDLVDNAPNSSLISEAADLYSGQPVNTTLRGRTFYADCNWNTLCLPFDVTLADSPLDGAEARTLTGASLNDGTLTLNFSEPVEKLTAGTPYIFKLDKKAISSIYIIWSTEDWDAFADSVNKGVDFSDMTVYLAADITVSTPVGTMDYPFIGIFDGNGHTLTFNSTASEQIWAPFRYVKDATINNLHVAGTITTNYSFCSGLVGENTGPVSINNCRVSVDFVADKGTYIGAFIGALADSYATIRNSLFDGSFTNKSGIPNCGGFVANPLIDVTQYFNCLSMPKDIKGSVNYAPFNISITTQGTLTNCYYSEGFPMIKKHGSPIGDMTNEQLAAALGDGWEVKDGKVVPVMGVNNTGSSIVNPVFYGTAFTATEPINITPGLNTGTDGDCSVTFVGTYDPVEIGEEGDNTKLYFSNDNTLYWPNGAMTINPFHAYFQLNTTAALARAYKLSFGGDDDETTGILRVVLDNPSNQGRMSDDAWYTLDGRKLDGKPTHPGIYIQNGKKYMIK